MHPPGENVASPKAGFFIGELKFNNQNNPQDLSIFMRVLKTVNIVQKVNDWYLLFFAYFLKSYV